MRMNRSLNWLKAVGILVVVGMLAGTYITFAYASVEAGYFEEAPPRIKGNGVGWFFNGVLVRTFRYQISMTDFIGHSLINAGSSITRAQARIDRLIDQGKEVTILKDAVAESDKLIEEADDAYHAAQSLVDLHSGFDEKGQVVDRADARETIKAIEPNLKVARDNIIEAIRIIYEAVQEFQLESDD